MTRNEMIEKNIGLVSHVMKKYKFPLNRYEYQDLYQVGCIGLIKAVDNYKEDRNSQFSTYACVSIHHTIVRYILQQDNKSNKAFVDLYYTQYRTKNNENYGDKFNDEIESNYLNIDNIEKRLENEDMLARITKNLTPKEKVILWEYEVDGMILKDIAKQYNVSSEAIRQNLVTAKEKCRKEYLCLQKEKS